MIAGRLRKVGVPYALPTDPEEQNRLGFQHYVLRFTFKGTYAAPLDIPRSFSTWDAGLNCERSGSLLATDFFNGACAYGR